MSKLRILLAFALIACLHRTASAQPTTTRATPMSPDEVRAVLDREIRRSRPDYIVYRPGSLDGSTFDTGNEHFLVFDGPDGSLMTVWTQSSYEDAGDHRSSRRAETPRSLSQPSRTDRMPGYSARAR